MADRAAVHKPAGIPRNLNIREHACRKSVLPRRQIALTTIPIEAKFHPPCPVAPNVSFLFETIACMTKKSMMFILLVISFGLAPTREIAGQGFSFPIEFTGYYALEPERGDNFGNWIRTGNLRVDTSSGLTLELDGPGTASFMIVVPGTMQINTIFYTWIVGTGSMTFHGKALGMPITLDGNYVASAGSFVSADDVFGWELRADANSQTAIDIAHFLVIPEPSNGPLFILGGSCFIAIAHLGRRLRTRSRASEIQR
jgi:hypothetical protein